jgi:hypothetical protein
MDALLNSITTLQGAVGVAITMAFILILVKPVRAALMGSHHEDPVLHTMNTLIAEIKKSNEEAARQNAFFAENIQKFAQTITGIATIQSTLSSILTELVRSGTHH